VPDVPNPITALSGAVGSSIAEAAASAFNTAMKALWDFAISLLGAVFAIIDHLTTPDLDPRTGPLASVLPATAWIGGALLLGLCLVQIGKAAINGGAGLLHLGKGIAQYLVVTASALGILTAFVTAANAAALGILSSGLNVDSWQGIAATNSAWQNSVNAVSGVGLGLIALLGVLPAAISLLVTALVREAAILVIAATIPILAAGLVAEATARWFWTALRWLLALVLLTPTVAVVLSVGLQLAAGAAGGTPTPGTASTDAGQSAVTALVAAAVLLVSVFCPLALFKLFAFVDPATPSGQRLRTSATDRGAAGTAASSNGNTQSENDTREQVESRWTQALGRVSEAYRALGGAAQGAVSTAGPVLAAAGVGTGADPELSPGSRSGGAAPGRGAGTSGSPGSSAAGSGSGSSDPPPADPPTPPDVIPPPPRPDDSGGLSGGPAGGSGGKPPAGGPKPGGPAGGGAGGSSSAAVAAA
jgi:hypothetical protein